MLYPLIRRLLFTVEPEKVHYLTMNSLSLLNAVGLERPFFDRNIRGEKPTEVLGLRFPNPVGLGAGFDKNARYIPELSALGFGFVEIGTVTPRPQAGNEKPRLFRLPQDQALINRMGFNNDGAEIIARRLDALRHKGYKGIIGGNIGKNKDTPNEESAADYRKCFEALHPYVDYFVVNVSSPNTPGLRALQDKDSLLQIVDTLQQRNQTLRKPLPVLLKIAPDLNENQLEEIAEVMQTAHGFSGLIATNTTITRENLQTPPTLLAEIGAGGLSGAPLQARGLEVLQFLRGRLPAHVPLISSGGIMDANTAIQRMGAGASLVQLYTGFVYGGPPLIHAIRADAARRQRAK